MSSYIINLISAPCRFSGLSTNIYFLRDSGLMYVFRKYMLIMYGPDA